MDELIALREQANSLFKKADNAKTEKERKALLEAATTRGREYNRKVAEASEKEEEKEKGI